VLACVSGVSLRLTGAYETVSILHPVLIETSKSQKVMRHGFWVLDHFTRLPVPSALVHETISETNLLLCHDGRAAAGTQAHHFQVPNSKTHIKVAHAAVCETARQHLLRDDNTGKRKSPGRRDDKFASLSIYKQYLWHLRLALYSPAPSLDLEYTSIPLPRISHIRVPCLPGQSAARRLYTSSYCK